MTPAIISVKPLNDYSLHLTFENGETKRFDMKPYLATGQFKQLKDIAEIKKVRISFDTIEWENKLDFDPEILYEYGIEIIK